MASPSPPEGVEDSRSTLTSSQFPNLTEEKEKTVPYSVYSNILEKLSQVEDQRSLLQQKVDEQKNEIMQICLREKELQYQIREQSLHHKMERIQNSKSQEVALDVSLPTLRHSEGSGITHKHKENIPEQEKQNNAEIKKQLSQINKELELSNQEVEKWKSAFTELKEKYAVLEGKLHSAETRIEEHNIQSHNNSTVMFVRTSVISEQEDCEAEILATEDKEEQLENIDIKYISNQSHEQNVATQNRTSMRRHKECFTSGIMQWNKKTHPTPSHAKGKAKFTCDSDGEEVLAYVMENEESADEEIPNESSVVETEEDCEKTLEYRATYTSLDERLPTPTPKERKKSTSFIGTNVSRELRKRVLSTHNKQHRYSVLGLNDSIQSGQKSQDPFLAVAIEPWRTIEVNELVIVKSIHNHLLQHIDMIDENGKAIKWLCNGSEIFHDGCKSGQTELRKHTNTLAWRCQETDEKGDECDFDLCQDCIRWVLYCEYTGTILGTVISTHE